MQALRDQLGLALKSDHVPYPVLVVDHVEKAPWGTDLGREWVVFALAAFGASDRQAQRTLFVAAHKHQRRQGAGLRWRDLYLRGEELGHSITSLHHSSPPQVDPKKDGRELSRPSILTTEN
jgi:hypothetical protein